MVTSGFGCGGTDGTSHGRFLSKKYVFLNFMKTRRDIDKIVLRGNITRGALSHGTSVSSWVLPVLAALGGGRTEFHTDVFTRGSEFSKI